MGFRNNLVFRQPFPGPGLGIRIIGDVTAEKVTHRTGCRCHLPRRDAQSARTWQDAQWMPNQYFAALTNMRSVGVMGDERTYDYAVALRAVTDD